MCENSFFYETLNLNCHGVIDASAGTGKTYTLVELTLKYIIDKKVDIKNIVLVTYTKSAASEIKSRIKQAIRERLLQDQTNLLLLNAYQNLDEATITTIHGFCKKILSIYPFENGGVSIKEINGTSKWKETIIKDYIRNYEGSFDNNLKDSFELFCRVVKNEAIFSTLLELSELDDLSNDLFNQFESLEQFSQIDLDTKETILSLDDNLNFTTIIKTLGARSEIDLAFSQFKKELSQVITIKDLYIFLDNIATDYKKLKEYCLKDDIKASKYEKLSDDEKILFDSLVEYFTNQNYYKAYLMSYFCYHAIPKIKNYIDLKREGRYSFNDLLTITYNLLQTKPAFKTILANNFKIALVDEFQDTNAIQWSIIKNIFVDNSQATKNVCLIIGDAKQSIYRFAHANPYIYETAKIELTNKINNPNFLTLATNYRSNYNVVESCNIWFKKFIPNYIPSRLPADKIENNKLDSNLKTTFLDLSHHEKISDDLIYDAYAKEIIYLLHNDSSLKPSDFAVLLNKNNDLKKIKQVFNYYNLPSVLMANDSIYQSDGSDFILKLLFILSRPIYIATLKELLLSPLFALTIDEIENSLLDNYLTKALEWQRLANSGKWAIMLSNVLECSGYLERELKPDNPNKDRNYSNIKQLFDIIINLANSSKNNTKNVYNLFANLVLNNDKDENESEKPLLETDADAIKLMTSHKSKGLEFKIVFTVPPTDVKIESNFIIKYFYKLLESDKPTIDFLKSSKSKEILEKQEESEKERLFYVLLTRAKSKIYLYLHNCQSKTFYNKLLSYLSDSRGFEGETLLNNVKEFLRGRTLFTLEAVKDETRYNPIKHDEHGEKIELAYNQFENECHFKEECEVQSSYSSLVKYSDSTDTGSFDAIDIDVNNDTDNETTNKNDDDSSGNVFNISLTTIDLANTDFTNRDLYPELYLPRGAVLGNFLHNVLENLDFTIASTDIDSFKQNPILNDLIEKKLPYALSPNSITNDELKHIDYMDCFKAMIWHTLNQEIFTGFSLKDLPSKQTKREFPFLVNVENNKHFDFEQINGLVLKKGYLKGIVDLVFMYENKYYILDWKSNYLGDSYDNYEPNLLKNSMLENKYNLQYYVYLYALYLYGKSLNHDFSYEGDMGGVIYVFNRGCYVNHTNQTGFFIDKPNQDDFNKFIAKLI